MTVLKSPDDPATIEVAAVEKPALELSFIPPVRARRVLRLSTTVCFGISILVFLAGVALANSPALSPFSGVFLTVGAVLFLVSTLVALARILIGTVAFVQAVRGVGELSAGRAIVTVAGNLFWAVFGMLVAYVGTIGFSRGRQLRRRGTVLLPALRENAEWTDREITLDASEAPAGLAERWRENGKTEHASVAAFARLTLDLMALGAPPTLVAAANQDSLDEIRHAELCFSLATALDGTRWSPAPFPEAGRVPALPRSRPLALARLAVTSLVDGALHEGVSARILAQLAKRCAVPAIRDLLKSIAADEGRHAAHGWTVVEWCLQQGGSGVGEALLGALRALPAQMRSDLPPAAADGGWERWGIHGHALEAGEYGEALARLAERVRARVAASSRAA